jgi:hypothetical protein
MQTTFWISISGILMFVILALAVLGEPIAKKFLRGLAGATSVYVTFELDGKTLVFKDPGRGYPEADRPLNAIPAELFMPDKFEISYNVCWFDDLGILGRCDHPLHRTVEEAARCQLSVTPHSFIGKVLEER